MGGAIKKGHPKKLIVLGSLSGFLD